MLACNDAKPSENMQNVLHYEAWFKHKQDDIHLYSSDDCSDEMSFIYIFL